MGIDIDIDIDLKLTPAVSLGQFRVANGKGQRIIGMIYFNRLSDGTLWMENIKEDTDANMLNKLISEGRIYVVKEVKEK